MNTELSTEALENEINKLKNDLNGERAIVDRIWKMLGNPSYEDLKGRTIYDLIQEDKDELEELRAKHKVDIVRNERDFSTVAHSLEALTLLRDEINWFLNRCDAAMSHDYFDFDANLGNVLDVSAALANKSQLTKDNIRGLVNIGETLSVRKDD